MSQAVRTDHTSQPGKQGFLDLLASSEPDTFDCSDVLIVMAHPDDETIALGGQLPRLRGIRFLHVTDGAPENMRDAQALGFSKREDYAAARLRELEAALEQAGVMPDALLSLGIPDQGAAYRMPFLVLRLARIMAEEGISTVVTHAYEGGHPDHDATAFIVHAARHLILRQSRRAPEIVEAPLYHVRDGQAVRQRFCPVPSSANAELTIALDAAGRERKRQMLAAFRTQSMTLASFDVAAERFRLAPDYDFGSLPNGGELLYEAQDWGLKGCDWLRLVEETCREFGLPRWL